jgi:plastocyanin
VSNNNNMLNSKKFLLTTRHILLILLIATFGTTTTITTMTMTEITTTIDSYAQTGSMAPLQNIQAMYAVSIIPGAAQRNSTFHYYPPAIAVPTGTTIAWFNNDFGQPHTVTSGLPRSPDTGSVFNSGIMPATANSFFQYTFNRSGKILYHCEIHPWRVASVSVSDALERGNNFELSSGTGPVLNLTQDFRTLLVFKPITVPLDGITPLTYNIIILKNNTDTVFSRTFTTVGEPLPLELIAGSNETRAYGPDFSSTGPYHLEGAFLKGNADFKIIIQMTTVNAKPPPNPIEDQFSLRTVA